MMSSMFEKGLKITTAILISTLFLAAGPANAQTIEFGCKRIDAEHVTISWRVDLATSTVSFVSVDNRWSGSALITPTSMDWQTGGDAYKWHLDRLSGHLTMTGPAGAGQVRVEYACQRTNGF